MADESSTRRVPHPAWHICPNTPEALHVCAAYPWQVDALVLDDGSAVGTSARASLSTNSEFQLALGIGGKWGGPGQTLCVFGALRHSYNEIPWVEADPNWHHMRCNMIGDPNPYPFFAFIGRKPPPFVCRPTTFKRLPPPSPSFFPRNP